MIAVGLYGLRLIAHIVVSKYRMCVSLHRIREDLTRMPSASIPAQILWATTCSSPSGALLDEITHSHLMQLDGTGMPVRHKQKGQTQIVRRGTRWLAVGDGRSAAANCGSAAHKLGVRDDDIGPEDLLRRRPRGLVLADADTIFDRSFEREELTERGCAMHARRYLVKALDAANKPAAISLQAFKKIYAIAPRRPGAPQRQPRRGARRVWIPASSIPPASPETYAPMRRACAVRLLRPIALVGPGDR